MACILRLTAFAALLALPVAAQTSTLITTCFDKTLNNVLDKYNNNQTCKAALGRFMRFKGPDTTLANCGQPELVLDCFLLEKQAWLDASQDCNSLWTIADCVVDFSSQSFNQTLVNRCDQQTQELINATTSAGSICRTSLHRAVTASSAKLCPAEAIVQQCFKNDTSVRSQWTTLLVQDCPNAFENSACLNAFNILTWNRWLDTQLPKTAFRAVSGAAGRAPHSAMLLAGAGAVVLGTWLLG